jgi:hypothetical protein
MAGDASAFAVLGLEPGADSAAIEQAYKRLIKEHHPDRDGGDARRAADINRAYRDLRATRTLKEPLELHADGPKPARQVRAWIALAMLLTASVGWVLLEGPFVPSKEGWASVGVPRLDRRRSKALHADPMDQPLHVAAIDEAASHAFHIARTRDEMALASTSRDCHHALRTDPSMAQLDRCAAFDDAVVQLQDRDPLRDQGPFSELAVTGRIWSGATALSDDSVAIEGRLDRIRLRVEVALAPMIQPIAPAPLANGG